MVFYKERFQMEKIQISQSQIDSQNQLYIQYIIEKSRNLWNLHISESGEEVMSFVSDFLSTITPERFGIAINSYIINSHENGFITSPQVDLIIYDKFVGGLNLFYDPTGKIKLIPKESVLGIFEIKRTLTKSTFETAVTQLKAIISTVEIDKSNPDTYLLGGIKLGDNLKSSNKQYRVNPFVGIIGLKSGNWKKSNKLLEESFSVTGFLDLVMCFDGQTARLTKGNNTLSIASPRDDITTHSLHLMYDKTNADCDLTGYYKNKITE